MKEQMLGSQGTPEQIKKAAGMTLPEEKRMSEEREATFSAGHSAGQQFGDKLGTAFTEAINYANSTSEYNAHWELYFEVLKLAHKGKDTDKINEILKIAYRTIDANIHIQQFSSDALNYQVDNAIKAFCMVGRLDELVEKYKKNVESFKDAHSRELTLVAPGWGDDSHRRKVYEAEIFRLEQMEEVYKRILSAKK